MKHAGRWWVVKAIGREFLCWLLWHDHGSNVGQFSFRCKRCGEHLERHSP